MMAMDSAQHTQVVAGVAVLAELGFSTGTVYVSTAPVHIGIGVITRIGLGSLLSVSNLHESADARAEQLTVSLSLADSAMLAMAMGNAEIYRGKPARIYLQLLSETFQPVGTPRQRWAGYMNKVQISRQAAQADGNSAASGSIDLVCSRSGMARARNREGLRLTDAQQQLRYPGDTGLRYVRELVAKPTQWLSKAFQQV